jgi:hypothetical protein
VPIRASPELYSFRNITFPGKLFSRTVPTPDFTACGKAHVSEGYGLQAVRRRFAMNPALAAEGTIPLETLLFSQAP